MRRCYASPPAERERATIGAAALAARLVDGHRLRAVQLQRLAVVAERALAEERAVRAVTAVNHLAGEGAGLQVRHIAEILKLRMKARAALQELVDQIGRASCRERG